jgi:hypothetical protein
MSVERAAAGHENTGFEARSLTSKIRAMGAEPEVQSAMERVQTPMVAFCYEPTPGRPDVPEVA